MPDMTTPNPSSPREEIARILTTIADRGLPEPRDLDVALDAIFCTIDAFASSKVAEKDAEIADLKGENHTLRNDAYTTDVARELRRRNDNQKDTLKRYGQAIKDAGFDPGDLSGAVRKMGARIATLTAELARLRERMERYEKAIQTEINTITKALTGSTHYEGCEEHHPRCAALKRLTAALSPQSTQEQET